MKTERLQDVRLSATVWVAAGLFIACCHPAFAQVPNAAITGSPVSFFSFGGRLDSTYDGIDQIYSSDAGLTLFLDGKGYGFSGTATNGSTGSDGSWTHMGTVQLTPNSYRDDLRVVTPSGNIDIQQLVSYFPGSESVNIETTITNRGSATYNMARLIYGADTLTDGSDRHDIGVEDFSATRSVGTKDDQPNAQFTGLSGFQSINDARISAMSYFTGFYSTVWQQIRSGSLPGTIDTRPRDQGIALSFDKAGSLRPGDTWSVRLQWIYQFPISLSLSSCNVTSPVPQSSHLGNVAIVFDGNNSNSNPINSTFEYSTDGGQIWHLCAAATSSPLSNPDLARATPFTGASFLWNPVANGIAASNPQVVDLRVSVVESGGGQIGQCVLNGITIQRTRPRLASIGPKTVDELSLLTFTATATPGLSPALVFSLENGSAGSVPSGASINPQTGVFTWSPTEAQGPGTFTFDVVVTGSSGSDRETIVVTVAEVNRPPVLASIGNRSVNEQVALAFTATATDPDLPANALTFSLAAGTGGAVPAGAAISAAGAFSWTPTEAQGPGTYTFDVVVRDSGTPQLSASETMTVTVAEVNRPPVLASIGNRSVNEQVALAFAATATDPDLPANALTFSLAAGSGGAVPAGAAISAAGAFSWTPTEAQGPGTYTFDVVVRDNGAPQLSVSETITVTVAEINRPPVLASIGNRSIDELVALAFTATATDPDLPANALTFSLAAGTGGAVPAGAAISAAGAFSWTPTEAQGPGTYTFDVVVRDNGTPQLSVSETITVTVAEINRLPVLASIGNRSIDELVALAFTATATDPDLPANALTFSLAAGTGGAVPAGAAISAAGAFSWTPTEAQGPGTYTFDVVVRDNGTPQLSASETVTVTVAEINRPPVLASIGNRSVNEQVALAFTATATDPDLPANALTFSLANGTGGAVPAGAAISAAGAFSWTPTEAQGPGTYTFDVVVRDNGTPQLSVSETITVTVAEINRPPVLASIGNRSVSELVALAFTATATDPDLPANALTFSLAAGTGGAVPAGAVISAAGAFSWTPTEAQGPGTYTFDIVVRDNGTPQLSVSETITVTVANVLDPTVSEIVSNINPSVFGQGIVFTTTVKAPGGDARIPGGTIELREGATQLGIKTLVNGQSTFTFADFSVATHGLTAVYSGDNEFQASTSSLLQQVVNRAATLSSVASSANPSAFGQDTTFTASVAAASPGAGIPSGTLHFLLNGNNVGTKALANGSATLTLSNLGIGSQNMTVDYEGSGDFLPSTSDVLIQVVNKAATTTVVTSDNNPSRLGERVTLTATVAVDPPGRGMPTGTVEILDGASSLGILALNAEGKAETFLETLTLGNHSITARYSGDQNVAANQSAPLIQTVNLPAFTIAPLAAVLPEGTAPTTQSAELTFTVTKNETTPGPTSIGFVLSGSGTHPANLGSDFDAPPPAGFPNGTLDFGAAAASQVLTIRAKADDLFEPDETFTVTLSNTTGPSLALTTASGTILNDDNLRVAINASQGTALEAGGSAPGVFTLTRNGTDGQFSVPLQSAPASTASFPADFTLGNVAGGSGGFTATFPEGTASIEISLGPVDDLSAEASEIAILELVAASDYAIVGSGSASITIPANDLTATTLADFNPAMFPNGGEGTLRQALLNASQFPGSDVIAIGPGVSGTLLLTHGELPVTSSLSIIGPGANLVAISGDRDQSGDATSGDSRVIRVSDANPATTIEVTLSGLTIIGGVADGSTYPANAGGGILNEGESLLLARSTVAQCSAEFGGGIENSGTLVLMRSVLSFNDASELGGGVDNFEGTLTVIDSTISDNAAGFGGGGIENSGNASISGSTLARNLSVKLAGGVDSFGGNIDLFNCTVSGNESQIGGGLVHENGLMRIVNCTVVRNTANLSLNANVGGGVYAVDAANTTVTLNNSIVAGNTRLFNAVTIPSDLGGRTVDPQSNSNLVGDAASAGGLLDRVNGNLTGINGIGVRPFASIVGPLGSNGGPTQTHALAPDSAAIDAGNNALAISAPSSPLEFDQRGSGFPRIAAARVDIGAYERNSQEIQIINISLNPTSGATITWIAEINKQYEVLRSVDLRDWTVVSPTLTATSEILQWTDSTPPASRAFYTVQRK